MALNERDLIVRKINSIKSSSNNFDPSILRWKNFFYGETLASELILENLTAEELVDFFEWVLHKYYKQM